MSLLAFCNALGRDAAARFKRCDYNIAEFPKIATDLLARHEPATVFSPSDVVDAALSPELSWQADEDSSFGEPAITLFSHPRFRIDALCWRNGTTSIHQHQFAGAFAVMWGSSLQSTFEFTTSKIISETFKIGNLRHIESAVLTRGHIEAILNGDRLIHSVFHLEAPSITLVMRTHGPTMLGIQFRYELPSLAYDPFERDFQSSKCLQIVDYLCDIRPTGYQVRLSELVSRSTIPVAFAVLRKLRIAPHTSQIWSDVRSAAIIAHGSVIDDLTVVLDHFERQHKLLKLRKTVQREDLRYMLALLLNVPDAQKIVAVVARRVGVDRAVSQMVSWIGEIANVAGLVSGSFDLESTILRAYLLNDWDAIEKHDRDATWRQAVSRLRTSYLTSALIPNANVVHKV